MRLIFSSSLEMSPQLPRLASGATEANAQRDRNELQVLAGAEDVVKPAFQKETDTPGFEIEARPPEQTQNTAPAAQVQPGPLQVRVQPRSLIQTSSPPP